MHVLGDMGIPETEKPQNEFFGLWRQGKTRRHERTEECEIYLILVKGCSNVSFLKANKPEAAP
jgi:hypothetical protein